MTVKPSGGFTPLMELPEVAYSSSSLPTSPGAHNAIVLIVGVLMITWTVLIGLRLVKTVSILRHLQPGSKWGFLYRRVVVMVFSVLFQYPVAVRIGTSRMHLVRTRTQQRKAGITIIMLRRHTF